jgi:hypothetical protein
MTRIEQAYSDYYAKMKREKEEHEEIWRRHGRTYIIKKGGNRYDDEGVANSEREESDDAIREIEKSIGKFYDAEISEFERQEEKIKKPCDDLLNYSKYTSEKKRSAIELMISEIGTSAQRMRDNLRKMRAHFDEFHPSPTSGKIAEACLLIRKHAANMSGYKGNVSFIRVNLKEELSDLKKAFYDATKSHVLLLFKDGEVNREIYREMYREEDIKSVQENLKKFDEKCDEIAGRICGEYKSKEKMEVSDYTAAALKAREEMAKAQAEVCDSSFKFATARVYSDFKKDCTASYKEKKEIFAEHSDSKLKRIIGHLFLAITAIVSIPIKWAVNHKKTGGEITWPFFTRATNTDRKAHRVMDAVTDISQARKVNKPA